jgi:hypothetical protein
MTTVKKVLVITLALLMGGLFLYTGAGEYRTSKRLAAEGRSVTAKVVDERSVYRTKGRSRYYLTVEFETTAKQSVTREVKVSRQIHDDGVAARSVTVHYLPEDPTVCQIGSKVEINYGQALIGALFVIGGLLLAVFYKQPASRAELAESVEEQLDTLRDTNQQHVTVDARQFEKADHAFYDECQRRFEAHGYVFLEDMEVVASKPNRNFARTFVRAAVFHLQPRWLLRVLGAKEAKVYGVDTQFSDGTFVSTDNAESCNALNSPEAINVAHLPASTTIEMVLEAHEKRVEAHSVFHPAALPVRMQSAEDVHRSMELAQRIKAGFRQEHGLAKEELERLGGASNNEVINNLHADLVRGQEEQKRKAA